MQRINDIIDFDRATNARVARYYPVAAVAGKSNLSQDLLIINQLAKEFSDISKKNIQSWRQGIGAAMNGESPKWQPIQDLFEYLKPDGHFGSQVDIRNGSIESNRYYIRSKADGKEQPEKTALFEQEWYFNLVSEMAEASIYGYSVFQIYMEGERVKWDAIARRNYVPQKRIIVKSVDDEDGYSVDDPAFKGSIIAVHHKSLLGIMNDIVPDLIWKKNSRATWAEFSEKFGIPLISATSNSRDPKERERIQAMLVALGKASTAVLPTGTTVDIKDTVMKNDPYNVFLQQMLYSDAQISKRILGGTMVSDNGSSRSQSEVHERTLNYIIAERERKKIEFITNDKIIPLLAGYGLPIDPVNDEFVFDRSEDLTVAEQWDVIEKALNYFDIPEKWISETFNFPIAGKKQAPSITRPLTSAQAGFFD